MRLPRALSLANFLPAMALAFENFEPGPGGIAGVTVGTPAEPAPRVLFGSHEVPVLRYPQGWVALVGISRNLAPGYYVVNAIDAESQHQSHIFAVRPVNRPVYAVDVSDQSSLGEVFARVKNDDRGDQLEALISEQVDTTGAAYQGGITFPSLFPACGLFGIESAMLIFAVGGLIGIRRRRWIPPAR